MDHTNTLGRDWSSLQHSQVSENNVQECTSLMYNTSTQVHPSSTFTYEGSSTAYTFSTRHASSPEQLARWYEQRLQERMYTSQYVLGLWLIRNSYFHRIHSSHGAKSGELWRWDNSQWPGSRSRIVLVQVRILVPRIGMARTRRRKYVTS
jgi:hypothetical protein